MQNLFITRDGVVYGPYERSDVQGFIRSGNLVPDDLACMEGDSEWRPLRDLINIAEPSDVPANGSSEGGEFPQLHAAAKELASRFADELDELIEEKLLAGHMSRDLIASERLTVIQHAAEFPKHLLRPNPLGKLLEAVAPRLLTEDYFLNEEIEGDIWHSHWEKEHEEKRRAADVAISKLPPRKPAERNATPAQLAALLRMGVSNPDFIESVGIEQASELIQRLLGRK